MESFHNVPAIVSAPLADPWLEVDFFIFVLADICYVEITCFPVE